MSILDYMKRQQAEWQAKLDTARQWGEIPGLQDALFDALCQLADRSVDYGTVLEHSAPSWGPVAYAKVAKKFEAVKEATWLQHTPLSDEQNAEIARRKAATTQRLTDNIMAITGGDVYEQLNVLAKSYGDKTQFPAAIFSYIAKNPETFANNAALVPFVQIGATSMELLRANDWIVELSDLGWALRQYFESRHGYYVNDRVIPYVASLQINANEEWRKEYGEITHANLQKHGKRPAVRHLVNPIRNTTRMPDSTGAADDFAQITKTDAGGFSTPDTLMRPAHNPRKRKPKEREPGDKE